MIGTGGLAVVVAPHLTFWRCVVIFGAGMAAGFINSIAGSGTLISFPTLTGIGFAAKTANVSNGLGLFPGGASAAWGFRAELKGQQARLRRLIPASGVGAAIGAFLLLAYPGSFRPIVPYLILTATALVIVQPRLQRALAARQKASERVEHNSPTLFLGVFLTGIYGGYFGAAQGIILVALLGTFLVDELKRINAAKNVLAALANGVSGVIFALRGAVHWGVAGLIAGGSVIGGQIGSLVGKRIPPQVLRGVIVVVGTTVAIKMLVHL